MVSLLPTKFHEILFSSFRGVALTNCYGQTDRTKTICLPTKVGGDIIIHRFSCLVTLLFHKWLHVRLNHKDACYLTLS